MKHPLNFEIKSHRYTRNIKIYPLILLISFFYGNQLIGQDERSMESEVTFPKSERNLSNSNIVVPTGYKIEAVQSGLSYPVDVTFDEQGNTYLAEAGGHTYGTMPPSAPKARIIKISPDSIVSVIYDKVVPMEIIKQNDSSNDMPEGLIPPLTGITYYKDKLYISHRSRYSVYDLSSNEFKTIINGLPSWGEFLNAKPIFKDDKMYWFLSTQGNSGVQEKHWVKVIDQFNKPRAKEIPGEDIELTGENYWVPTKDIGIVDADSVLTGVYSELGKKTEKGQIIKGQNISNGAFYESNLDGSNIRRLAWGLRSSFGYRFSPSGELVATMNSANPMPPRGLFFDYEPIYKIKEGIWYGWPDFYSGIPITDKRFEIKKDARKFVLTDETHRKLLKGKDRPEQPLAKLAVHTAAEGMVFGNGNMNLPENDILVAEFGAIVPVFKGPKMHPKRPPGVPTEEDAPEGVKYNWPGFKVQQVNLSSGEATDFIYNKSQLPSSASSNKGGLERPLQLEWDSEGNLYIVDFGIVEFNDQGMNAHPFSGVLWKVSKE